MEGGLLRKSSTARPADGNVGQARSGRCWIAVATAAAVLAGCGAGGSGGELSASTSQAIYGGTLDDDASGNTAVVAVRIGDGSPFELCSGLLVGTNVVLTAWHCVAQMTSTQVQCDQNGNGSGGATLGSDVPVATIHVFTGPQPNLEGAPSANATATFHPQAAMLCNQDIALIVLDRNITGIAPLRVRLVDPTAANESLRVVGYGNNDLGQPIGTRVRKDNASILATGAQVSASGTPLAQHEFELGESICQGDSGSPAIDEISNAVVGVASRGGSCTDSFGHIYTETAPFATLFHQAFAVAGGSVAEENGPAPVALAPDAGGPGPSPGGGPSGVGGDAGAPGGGASPPADPGPINLRAGAGNSCATAPGSQGDVGAWILALAALVAARRRRS